MRAFLKKQIFFNFFIFLISLSKANSREENLACNTTIRFDTNEVIQYSLKVLSNFENQYIKIEVFEDSKEKNYILSAYSDISRTNRIQLSQSYNSHTKLYLAPGQKIDDVVYFDLECSEYSCSGRIENSYSDDIDLEEGETLNYYVSNSNLEMKFSLTSKENSEISNIWARGQLRIVTELDLSKIKKENENYYITNQKMNKQKFIVKGTIGDYINVGFIGFKNGNIGNKNYYISQTNLIVDEAVLTGYLKKGSLDKVCYPIIMKNKPSEEVNIYGTGIISTKIAYSFISDKDGTNITSPLEPLNKNGYIVSHISSNKIDDNYFCITFPPENNELFKQFISINEIVFTYQLTQGLTKNSYNIYEPQIRGIFYPRVIKKDSRIVLIPQNNGEFEKMHMDLLALSGFPKMTIVQCDNYPICSLADNSFNNATKESPVSINRISSYSYKKLYGAKYSPISKSQTLFVVECKERQKTSNKESNYNNDYCFFSSLIYNNNDKIELIENNFYNQYALKDQNNFYKIKLQHESGIKNIYIDIITFSGEINVIQDIQDGISCNQYSSINKIYLSCRFEKPSENLFNITFAIKATSNSYYTVLYNLGRGEIDEMGSVIKHELQSGISYLVTLNTSKLKMENFGNKVVIFTKEKNYDSFPFMINFYSLNCEIEVHNLYYDQSGDQKDKILTNNFNSFTHDIINQNDVRYKSSSFKYKMKINKEEDYSEYKNKLCKVYVSAIELNNEHDIHTRDIIIPDNTPQQVMFGNNITHASYGYINVNHDKDLIVKFRPFHIAQYKVKIYFNGIERKSGEESIIDNDAIFIKHDEWAHACNNNNEICYIQLDITLVKIKGNDKEKEKPVLEFSIKSIGSSFVTYIQKNIMRIDYVQNNQPQYYYTEIDDNEISFITLNFFRGNGKVFGKIVNKNISDQNPDWKGKCKLPDENDIIKFDPFTNKAIFDTYENGCNNGCYLLLAVKSEVETLDIQINRNYPYSIIVYSDSFEVEYPPISIPLDQYVIGTIDDYDTSNQMCQFYSVLLNSDSEEVIIDLQIETGGMFINVGNDSPSAENYDFKIIPQGKDTIHYISRSDILKIGNLNSLKNAVLTLGIWANSFDNIYTTLFSFLISLGSGNEKDIYKVNSNQKTLCKTKHFADGKNRCLFIIDYDYINDFNNLFIYVNIQTKSTDFRLYGNYISKHNNEITNKEELEKVIPKEGHSTFSSKELNDDYLYIPDKLPKDTNLLISVETNKETIVELISTFCSYQKEIIPNPTLPQLLMVPTNYTISLNFPNSFKVTVNLKGIGGSAEIYWEDFQNHKYYLKGRDDRLSISSYKSDPKHKLLINATGNIKDGNGFIFYTTYGLRLEDINFDSLILDRSVNYVYSENDFPINYYMPINISIFGENDYYEIFFSFNILESEEKKNFIYYEDVPFKITGSIVPKNLIYEAKLNPDITIEQKNKKEGIFDQALRTGYIKVNRKFISESKVKDRPYLYLKIEKINDYKDILKYKRISLEATAIQSLSSAFVSELSYQTGELSQDQNVKEYLLRVDTAYKYIILQFSSSFDALTVEIKENKFALNKILDNYGKRIYLIDKKKEKLKTITLVISRKDKTKKEDNYFMLQYTNTNESNYAYSIQKKNIKVKRKDLKQEKDDYMIEFAPVNNYKNYDYVNYIIRFYNDIQTDRVDLSLRNDQKQIIKEFYNPKVKKGKIKLELTNCSVFNYFQVIAQIKNKEVIEYLSYDLNIKKNQPKNITHSILIIIGITLVSVVITLIIVIIIFNKKNNSLLDKVNQISFVQDAQEDEQLIKAEK